MLSIKQTDDKCQVSNYTPIYIVNKISKNNWYVHAVVKILYKCFTGLEHKGF